MPTNLTAESSVTIEAPRERVWEALTTPEVIKKWFFGVDTESDWKEGSSIVHKGEWQGKPYEDKGKILKVEPPTSLVHTHWSPASGTPDTPENYQRVTYELSEMNGGTKLTIKEVNIPNEEAEAVSEKSWKMVLSNLKEELEQN